MTRLSIERWLDAENDRVMRQRVKIDSAPSTRAYSAARSAGAFVQQGFASESGEDRTFYAPDADVLLDDGFAAGYCFNASRPGNLAQYVSATSGTALLVGRVSGPDGPLAKVRVKIVDGPDAETGPDGIFVHCRGNIGDRLTIDFERRGMQAAT